MRAPIAARALANLHNACPAGRQPVATAPGTASLCTTAQQRRLATWSGSALRRAAPPPERLGGVVTPNSASGCRDYLLLQKLLANNQKDGPEPAL
ncbi:hypothetical protein PI124_g4229 [Phytophthora idaei]|nr:hypothetical protein PI125_g3745 [Phytophthora idaei]KAG3251132.1 hypothetical protein PI124_g4229 [Phytophthora idaei]